MISRVMIRVIEPGQMRYRTVGDWEFGKDGELFIRVADTGVWIYNMLVAIHELIEAVLCRASGITTETVDRFDRRHQDDDDPGEHPQAPYHREHMAALSAEIAVATIAGVPWRPYEKALTKAWRKTSKGLKFWRGG